VIFFGNVKIVKPNQFWESQVSKETGTNKVRVIKRTHQINKGPQIINTKKTPGNRVLAKFAGGPRENKKREGGKGVVKKDLSGKKENRKKRIIRPGKITKKFPKPLKLLKKKAKAKPGKE